MKNKYYIFLLLVIIFLGFGLRTYQVGRDSFWNDEAAQAIAVTQPSTIAMLATVKTHVMMMPLDYVVGRIASKIGTTEAILRFPSVLWGTLALLALFFLTRFLTDTPTALFATLLFSLSPPHIRYAQEFRPYASLYFFYLLSSFLLFKAIVHNTKRFWLLFFVITLIGIYFHIHVALLLLNGFVFISLRAFFQKHGEGESQTRRGPFWKSLPFLLKEPHFKVFYPFGAASLALFMLTLPGFIYFGGGRDYSYELMQWDKSFLGVLLKSLGWAPFPFSSNTPPSGIWEIGTIILSGIGLLYVLKNFKTRLDLFSLVLGSVLQISLIIGLDAFKGYWFTARQILHIAPVVMVLSGFGFMNLTRDLAKIAVTRLGPKFSKIVPISFASLVVIGMCLGALPRITDYYEYVRSNAKDITARIIQSQQPGEPIFIIPGYEEKIFRYYFIQAKANDRLSDLRPVAWPDLPSVVPPIAKNSYFTTSQKLLPENQKILANLGYSQLEIDGPAKLAPNSLFIKVTPY